MRKNLNVLILFSMIYLILLIIPFSYLGYGIWAVIHSKKISDNKKSNAFLSTGIITIIIGLSVLIIELCLIYTFKDILMSINI